MRRKKRSRDLCSTLPGQSHSLAGPVDLDLALDDSWWDDFGQSSEHEILAHDVEGAAPVDRTRSSSLALAAPPTRPSETEVLSEQWHHHIETAPERKRTQHSQFTDQIAGSNRSRGVRPFRLAVCLILAALCAGWGLFSGKQVPQVLPQLTAASRPATPPTTIESIRVGERVMGSHSVGELAGETQVNPTTWRKLRLSAAARWPDGTRDDIRVETLQPPEWIEQHSAVAGASLPLPLDAVEMGLPADLPAHVEAIEPCPPIKAGPGRVVLTTVNHLNNDVYELSVAAVGRGAETLRPTGLHKFYRPLDDAWVCTKDLRPGDQLQGIAGPITVHHIAKLPGTQRVYNLTVEGEHVYRVSDLGALVHNNCPVPDPRRRTGYDPGEIHQDHPVARALGGDPNITRDLEAAANLRKGGLEGELRKYQNYLMANGLSEEKALQVIQSEIESLSRDVIASPFTSVFPPGTSINDFDQ